MHKKEKKNFVAFRKVAIFAIGNIADGSNDALLGTLCDRLANFDLVKSGKFNPIEVKSSLVKPVLYPDEGRGLSYYICDFGYFQNLTRQVCREDVSFSSCCLNVKLKNYKNYVRENGSSIICRNCKILHSCSPCTDATMWG